MSDDSLSPDQQGQSLVVDFAANSESLKIGQEIYVRILKKAAAQTVDDLVDFEQALGAGDVEVIQKISHRWKGDYDNLRVSGLSCLAKAMNVLVKDGQLDQDKLAEQLRDFKSAFVQLQQILENST